ncbi:complex I NDUFA9 subunit family protein [Microvirga arsenatis]|uniref:NAD-dependent epimerase/dehydratase family protein n=1 Tax=Microvirga arsenatis TaxID=2692265 RepID=A0ABW9YWC5_9HYPH|nr:complex I NDUFA9 subunit family protein [Microvirga arsenatis]NBJ09342.1 NAD-dependent epimerase/dehydratase family protein [Microvirga arsenatis]NBJ23800.1 NAD-dependent epimerase/dehydratase family protein [Microvirga arsenatis]
MIGALRTPEQQIVTVFGGSGFLGRYVVSLLAQRGYRVLVPTRQPNLANFLPLGKVGQIHPIHANLRHPDSVAHAVARADHVVNLVGILQETRRQRFDAIHAQAPALIAEAARKAVSFTHVSAIGADANSESAYARSKAEGEAALLRVRPDAVILRPSLLFGPGDNSFNRFATLARMLPVLPLPGADTRFQPIYAGDVAAAIVAAVDGKVPTGRTYELGGPEIRTLRQMMDFVFHVTERRRAILPVPAGIARAMGSVLGGLDWLTLGLMPNELVTTRDQAILLERDNVVSESARAEGRTLEALGVTPTTIEAIVPSYLVRFRKSGQFDLRRNATPGSVPDLLAPQSGGAGSDFHPDRAIGPAVGQRASR